MFNRRIAVSMSRSHPAAHGASISTSAPSRAVCLPTASQQRRRTTYIADSNLTNNTNICSSVTLPSPAAPDLSVTNACTLYGPNTAMCTLTLKNIGTVASPGAFTILDAVPSGPPDASIGPHGGGLQPLACSGTVGSHVQPQTCNFNHAFSPGETQTFYFVFNSVQGGVLGQLRHG